MEPEPSQIGAGVDMASVKEEKWPVWCCSYEFQGKQYGLEVPARTAEEASERLRAIGLYGSVDGKLMGVIPAGPGVGLYVRFVCWWRNKFGWRA